jgi:hypothetical protein
MGSIDSLVHDRVQINIYQEGSDVYAIATVRWPAEAFRDPVVYAAAALPEGARELELGWKVISRKQFEWLTRHYGCVVAYCVDDIHPFYCHNHRCWERDGRSFSEAQMHLERWVENFAAEMNYYEEREI